jgi:hypothetical protein
MNEDLTSFTTTSISAKTVVLENVAFSGTVILNSAIPQLAPLPNTGQPVQVGDVNFISGVTYNGSPAQYFIGRGITLGVAH